MSALLTVYECPECGHFADTSFTCHGGHGPTHGGVGAVPKRYGPYVLDGETVEKAARGVDEETGPNALTQDECEFYALTVLGAVGFVEAGTEGGAR